MKGWVDDKVVLVDQVLGPVDEVDISLQTKKNAVWLAEKSRDLIELYFSVDLKQAFNWAANFICVVGP